MRSRTLARAISLSGTIFASTLVAFVGCSSDDNNNNNNGIMGDGGTPDSTVMSEPDGSQHDAAPVPEAGPDASSSCSVFDASALDEASVAAGFEAVWKVYRCQGCHQRASQTVDDAGRGIVLSGNNDGLGDSGTIFPPNLTNDPTGLGCWTDQQIATAILDSKDVDGGAFCVMPKWGATLMLQNDGGVRPGTPMDAGTAQEIIDFLRSLPPVHNEVHETTCPSAPATTDGGASDAGDAGGDAGDAGGDAGDAGGDAGDGG